jgi:hypothetical protein
MAGYWDASRHEDAVSSGTPDVSWAARQVNGWLELKVVDNWPKKNNEVVPAEIRPSQRVFLKKRSRFGKHLGVFIYIKKTNEYFLFLKPSSISAIGKIYTQLDWHVHCDIHAIDHLPEPTRFLDVLTGIRRYGEL